MYLAELQGFLEENTEDFLTLFGVGDLASGTAV